MPRKPVMDRDLDIADVESPMPTTVAADFNTEATAYVRMRDRIEGLEKQKKSLRDRLMAFIETYGYDTSNGSLALDLPKPVAGVVRLVRQRSAKKDLDADAAEQILRSRGLWDRCTTTVRVLNEDEIMACLYEGELTDGDMEEMFPVKEIYSLVAKKK